LAAVLTPPPVSRSRGFEQPAIRSIPLEAKTKSAEREDRKGEYFDKLRLLGFYKIY